MFHQLMKDLQSIHLMFVECSKHCSQGKQLVPEQQPSMSLVLRRIFLTWSVMKAFVKSAELDVQLYTNFPAEPLMELVIDWGACFKALTLVMLAKHFSLVMQL